MHPYFSTNHHSIDHQRLNLRKELFRILEFFVIRPDLLSEIFVRLLKGSVASTISFMS